jgi:hypothetical protein
MALPHISAASLSDMRRNKDGYVVLETPVVD